MTYTPTDWVNDETLVSEARMDNIEQGIVDAHTELANVNADIADIIASPPSGVIEYENIWVPGTAYQPGDVVRYNGIEYLAVNGSTGSTPPAVAGSTAYPVVGYGTALPSPAVDGQEFIYVDSLTAPTYSWRFRYVAAKATYKWVFIGGPELLASTATGGSLAFSGTITDIPNTPYLTVPLTGVYIQRLMAQMSGTPTVPYICNIDNAANAATLIAGPASAAATWGHTAASTISGGLNAGSIVKMRGSSAQAVTFNFAQRSLSLLPVAVQ